jgi:TMEM175 potassium channel family protein
MGKGRLEAFSDGVLAIIITIMVLELRAPHDTDLAGLRPLLPVLLSYVLSFVFLGIYWNNHHHMLFSTRRVNGAILWANLHLLFWLSLVPLVTAWMGEHPLASTPAALYGVVLLMAGIAYLVLQQQILRSEGPGSVLAAALVSDIKGKLSPLLYLLAIAAAFVHPGIAYTVYLVVALMWLIPDRRIERALAAAGVLAGALALPGVARPAPSPGSEPLARLEAVRLRAHFDSVDAELRRANALQFTSSQRKARATLIDWLQEYRDAGQFPRNDRFPGLAMPFFRDSNGTLCAMAYLIERSGRGDLVDRFAKTRNNAFIAELATDPELRVWLDSVGLSVAEAARIQPTYWWKEIEALVARYDSAWNQRDTSAVSRLLAPQYQYFTSRGGVSSRAETMAMLSAPDYRLEHAKRSEIAVSLSSPVAVVSSRWQGHGTYRGQPFKDDQRCGQTWLLQSRGVWQLLSEHCVQITPATPPASN